MSDLDPSDHFRTHGWLRIPGAFSAQDAARMCDVIWQALAAEGIERANPATWTIARPEHLQHLKRDPVFRAVGSDRTLRAIDAVLEGQAWQVPKDWGAFFLQFPTRGEWDVASTTWHIDGDYTGALAPPCGVKVHAMLSDVEPRGGGMHVLSGSHRLVHQWFTAHPPAPQARGAQLRKSLQRHPYLRDLHTPGDPQARVARFHERIEQLDGIALQVIENTAVAGDVILMHVLLLHAPPVAHHGTQPRFLLNQGVMVDPDWWRKGAART
ncbi:MAG TPA: phytanoyl-CoA dioxygenase family protein [Steroidobacteraceae bacterium]|jgi:hypothetical protein|nr:phytanoyl-CoA dioxygenase family protein [Steroidobacteraceae bacterium]